MTQSEWRNYDDDRWAQSGVFSVSMTVAEFVSGITGRSYRVEATKPSYDLLTAVRTRRHHWLGHILRMPADRLVRRAVLALGQRAGPPYQPGSLLMNTPLDSPRTY